MSDIKEVTLETVRGHQVFTKEHAERILVEQVRLNRDDWKIKKGQNIVFKDGKIISSGNKRKVKKSEQAGTE